MVDEALSMWEYRVETVGSTWSGAKDEQLRATLNEWGEQGWEVINVLTHHSTLKVTIVAKRLLTCSVRRQRSREVEM